MIFFRNAQSLGTPLIEIRAIDHSTLAGTSTKRRCTAIWNSPVKAIHRGEGQHELDSSTKHTPPLPNPLPMEYRECNLITHRNSIFFYRNCFIPAQFSVCSNKSLNSHWPLANILRKNSVSVELRACMRNLYPAHASCPRTLASSSFLDVSTVHPSELGCM